MIARASTFPTNCLRFDNMLMLRNLVVFFVFVLLSSTVTFTEAANSWNSFPITPKSTNFIEASTVSYYKLISPEGLEDPHAVVGNPVKLGGYVLAGKAMECGDTCSGGRVNSKTESFATKHDKDGNIVWKWTSNNLGKNDAANGILELPSGNIIVVGWRSDGTVGYRYMTKLAGDSGVELWTFKSFGDSVGSNGGIELITMSGTDHIIVSGLKNKPNIGEMAFKSYGNSEGGLAWIAKIKISSLEQSSAPSLSDVVFEKTFVGYMSSKATATASNGQIAVLLWGEGSKACGIQMISNDGSSTIWGPKDYASDSKLEGTDLKFNSDNSLLGISGHGKYLKTDKFYSGKLVIIQASDGLLKTTTEITTLGNPELIYNECWGLVDAGKGFVVACGTGIEGCGSFSGTLKTSCDNGEGDPNLKSIRFGPGIWASLAAKVSYDGKLIWQRMDNYRGSEDSVYTKGTAYNAPTSSASEWVIQNSDGSLAFIQDESAGYGIMKLKDSGGNTPGNNNDDTLDEKSSGCWSSIARSAVVVAIVAIVVMAASLQ
jgi:hypothetical protein